MMKKSIKGLFLAMICMLFMLVGCSDSKEKVEVGGNQINMKSEDTTKKYNSYVEFLDVTIPFYERYLQEYLASAGGEETLAENKSRLETMQWRTADGIRLYEVYKNMPTDMRAVAEKDPSFGTLDENLNAYLDDYTVAFELLLNQIEAYYMDKTYETDDYTMGQELHTKLLEIQAELDADYSKLWQEFNLFALQMQGADLPDLEKEGRKIHAEALRFVIQSQEIGVLLTAQENETNFLDIDLEVYEPMYKELEKTRDKLKTLASDSSQVEAEGYSHTGISGLEHLQQVADQFVSSAKDLYNMAEAKTTEIDNEPTGDVISSNQTNPVASFLEQLDKIISAYNRSIS